MGAIDGIAGSITSGIGARRDRKFNRKEAQKNRDFQERMSSTALSRQMSDAKSAGLNPILMASGGFSGGASSPSGSAAHSTAGGAKFAPGSFDLGGLVSAVQGYKLRKEQIKTQKQITEKESAMGDSAYMDWVMKTHQNSQASWKGKFYMSDEGRRLLKAEAYLRPIGSAAGVAQKLSPGIGKFSGGLFR